MSGDSLIFTLLSLLSTMAQALVPAMVSLAICRLPSDTGPCDSYSVKWFHDQRLGSCNRFWYGGCEGNKNRFDSENECIKACDTVKEKIIFDEKKQQSKFADRCSLEQSRGPCGKYTLKWYFDSQTSSCNMFWYGGCGGNDNRFDTEEECENNCLKDNEEDNQIVSIECATSEFGCCPDSQTAASGPNQEGCPSAIVTTTSACRRARYGCCPDGSSAATGPNYQGCPESSGTHSESDCMASAYGCCPDSNRAASGPNGEGCERKESPAKQKFDTAWCAEDKDKGKCSDYKVQWYFNTKMGSCTQFWYGGCGGNSNRFPTKSECEDACVHVKGPGICRLPKVTGPCRAGHPRFYFDYISGECQPFTYGGCRGNPNRFVTRKECETRCSDSTYIDSEDEDKTLIVGGCQSTRYGCCPDGVTAKYDAYDLCDTVTCKNTEYGCCEDGKTAASGPDYEGCDPVGSGDEPCHDSDYGCCPDGVTAATGPRGQGCQSREGDDSCHNSQYGCCPDGRTAARGPGGHGCRSEVTTTTKPHQTSSEDICRQEKSKGRCENYVVKWFFDAASQRCDRFWYGGCDDSANHFDDEAACKERCLSVIQTTAAPVTPRPRVNVCNQPKEVGPCRSEVKRWYYDQRQQRCVAFSYGGCSGNDNNFITKDLCERTCQTSVSAPAPTTVVVAAKSTTTMSGTDSVSLGQNIQLKCVATPRGAQTAYSIEWFFNGKKIDPHKNTSKLKIVQRLAVGTRNQVAELTVYNADSDDAGTYYCRSMPFGIVDSTRVDVVKEIATEAPSDPSVICMKPMKIGNCYAQIPKWYYNHKQGKCQQFQYGGCGGNSNNFESQSECEATCSSENICKLPSKTGNCRGYFKRWFYDTTSKECQQFIYGGCQGNPNNFESKKSCEEKCSPDTKMSSAVTGTAVCSLPRNSGNCNGYNIVWYYDVDMERCRQFIYTGCGGNENRFETDAECLQLCDGVSKDGLIVRPTKTPVVVTRPIPRATPRPTLKPATAAPTAETDICKLPSDHGRCPTGNNYTIWWYYDSDKALCKRFYYGGCGGNGNRFKTREECQEACTRKEVVTTAAPRVGCQFSTFGCCDDGYTAAVDVAHSNCIGEHTDTDTCSLPSDHGRCPTGNNYTIWWYYDSDKALCKRFYYGGCGGNANRFKTREECAEACVYKKKEVVTTAAPRVGCQFSTFGCCDDGYTAAVDVAHTNCIGDEPNVIEREDGNRKMFYVRPGTTVTINCKLVANSLNNGITWYRDGFLLRPSNRFNLLYNGSLVITHVHHRDSGSYACRVNGGNQVGQVQRFKLQVRVPLKILPSPQTIIVKPGQNAFLHCQVFGSPQPKVSWTKNGRKVLTNGRHHAFDNGTLIITTVREHDIGDYECRADNGVSGSAKRTVSLVVKETVTAKLDPYKGKVIEGGTIRLRCKGKGHPRPHLKWEKDGEVLENSDRVFMTHGELVIRKAVLDDSGVYTCVVSNDREEARAVTTVQVTMPQLNDKCENTLSEMNCKIILRAGLCGHRMFSKMCCVSCRRRHG